MGALPIFLSNLVDFGRQVGGGSEDVCWKGKTDHENILSDNVEWSTKNFWKTISTDVKANVKRIRKENNKKLTGGCSL